MFFLMTKRASEMKVYFQFRASAGHIKFSFENLIPDRVALTLSNFYSYQIPLQNLIRIDIQLSMFVRMISYQYFGVHRFPPPKRFGM